MRGEIEEMRESGVSEENEGIRSRGSRRPRGKRRKGK